ncbi:DUF6359 domain-containing protein [Streptococcus henryi]|uniref:DUF6359 domain-containing protein n=1 Tax=Streptococcus henryi TaxID=439219 RepID=UPI0003790566
MKVHFPVSLTKRLTKSALVLMLMLSSGLSLPTSYADNLTVPSYALQEASLSEVVVEGYITGALNSAGSAYDNNAKTNLALGTSPDAQASETIPLQLPTGAVRDNFNIVDHPELIGQYVRVTGSSQRYMGRTGVKSVTDISLLEDEVPESSLPDSSQETGNTETAPLKESTPISQVRTSSLGQVYTISGKIISLVNGWGGNGFYLQDDSGAGLYIYPKTSLGYKIGDSVQLTGSLGTYNNELQLTEITEHQKLTSDFTTPVTETTISDLATAPAATLVKIKNVVVGDISSDNYDNSTFTVTDASGNSTAVKLDSRTGLKTADLLEIISKGDTINLTGILGQSSGQAQIRPFAASHFEVVEKGPEDTSTAAEVTVGEIQGESHDSPYDNRKVKVKEVVVTSITANNNFYVQDINPDDNPATSDGINVYTGKLNTSVAVGDVLELEGSVTEYLGRGYDDRKETDLTITQIVASKVTKTGTAEVPAPIVIGKDRMIPADIIDNDSFADFDPEEDAIDFWESLEGMLVAVDDAKVLGPMKNKEIYVLSGNSTTPTNKVGGVSLRPDTNNTDIIPILLKSGSRNYKSGDYFTGRIMGPVTYSYTNYKVYVDDETLPLFNDGGIVPEVSNLIPDADKLSIASYNIENFSADTSSTKQAKVERIAKSFVSDLNSPDIIGLIEVQDNNGAKNDGTTDASLSANRLIQAIVAQGGPTYTYVDIAPENNQDGGAEGANIRVGFLYNSDRVSLSDKPVGTATDAVAWENGELNLSLGRIDPTNPAWSGVRKTLAAEFVFQGEKVVVMANHLNSKRGDTGAYGRIQPVTLASEAKRHELANLIADFTQTGLSQNPNANIVMLGDFNDYEFTKTIQLIETGGVTNLVSLHDEEDRFSYYYNGNNQSLDNMLISNHLLVSYEFDMIHVNSAFMEEHGRASDHDPLLVQLSLKKAQPETPEEPESGKSKKEQKQAQKEEKKAQKQKEKEQKNLEKEQKKEQKNLEKEQKRAKNRYVKK